MTYREKLAAIRNQMLADNIQAYIIPSADPHISEYLPDRYKSILFASGFTGSAGTLVITMDFAGLWTDGRYYIQAVEQLSGTGYELVKLKAQGNAEYIDWLSEKLAPGDTIAFDARLISVQLTQLLEQQFLFREINLRSDKDYLDPIWDNRPELPKAAAFLLDETITGEPVPEKLRRLRTAMQQCGAEYHLISSLDDIAWLFNIRGSDVKCNPVVLSFALISSDSARLFIDVAKLDKKDKTLLLSWNVEIRNYNDIEYELAEIPASGSILIDPKRNCSALFEKIPDGVKVIFDVNPTTRFKAVKNPVEIGNIRETMIKDGVALTRFYKWLEENIGQIKITEIAASEQLYQFRAQQHGFIGESFDTIAGYKAHGALPHYKAVPESNAELASDGLFLLDSGGQYLRGTTDITRVISLGNLTEEEKTDYTLVLKGMIDGVTARFPKGSKGYQIDAITRKPLWDYAANYGHGTGHGVGYFLNVHEGPQVFNAANVPVEIEPGMITSIEPGIYRPGKHGIRIENLVLTVPDVSNEFGDFYTFETLTICYIDTAAVETALLDSRHISWLNKYNGRVFEMLKPYLNEEEISWLQQKTKAI